MIFVHVLGRFSFAVKEGIEDSNSEACKSTKYEIHGKMS